MASKEQQAGPLSLSAILLMTATVYVLLTLLAQALANIPPWLENSPVELSTDFIASCGLVWALLQFFSRRQIRRARTFWICGSIGMALIWAGESAADGLEAPAFWLIISLWAIAACLLAFCLRHHALRREVRLVMQLGFCAQLIAHSVWAIQDGLLEGPDGAHPIMELITDAGELIAILSYLVALILSRHSLRRVHRRHAGVALDTPPRLRVCFPYIAQLHQVLHSLPIAAALARHYPEVEVHIAGATLRHLEFARELVAKHAGVLPIRYELLHAPWELRLQHKLIAAGGKKLTLRLNRDYFAGFDAVVTPERTSTYLRSLDLPDMKLIGTEHGAGDRAIAVVPEIALFDFMLLPGDKLARRLAERGYLRSGQFVSGIYSKFDWILPKSKPSPRLFDNDRPTVFYNPHFRRELSSWHAIGWQVLDFFARSDRYNLVFAPHVRLFDAPTPAKYRAFERYMNLPHMLIDLGSYRCIDMSYTLASDLYLGDVSSQVVEFLVRPRPCVFLNPRRKSWKGDPNYRFWELGPIVEDPVELGASLDHALQTHAAFATLQREYVQDTLGDEMSFDGGTRGAAAIVAYLRGLARQEESAPSIHRIEAGAPSISS